MANKFNGRWAGIVTGVLLLLLAGCGSDSQPVGRTQCEAAIARANYRWRVDYEPNRSSSNSRIRERFEFFDGTQLVNRNGEEPLNAVSGPDGDGIWWPALPPRPTPEAIEAARDRLESNDEPVIVRKVDYFLQCEAGDLTTDRRTYRRASAAFRAGQTLPATYSLGRVMQVQFDSAEFGESGTATEGEEQAERSELEAALPTPLPNRQPNPPISEREVSVSAILHVDPSTGSDENAGTSESPYRTITGALANAKPGDTVRLAAGTYAEVSGEVFPILVGEEISLVGDELRRGMNISIQGGGKYLSRTWGGQNVTVVAGDRARISGITFSNDNLRGTAIWVESGAPSISNNSFIANNREGVFASGNSSPDIRANFFVDNGGNGVSFTRESSGIFEGNTVSNSGYGISISESATPKIVGNTIANNRSGILVTGSARPILRENTITHNREDGIVAVGESAPIVRENAIAQNGQYDIHNATGVPLAVEGNDLASLTVQGSVQ